MKRLIYLKKWTIVRPSCFAPKERSALKKGRPRYISALKKVVPDISRPNISFPIELTYWVSRIEEQRKIIKNNEEKNPKLLFVHVHVYA